MGWEASHSLGTKLHEQGSGDHQIRDPRELSPGQDEFYPPDAQGTLFGEASGVRREAHPEKIAPSYTATARGLDEDNAEHGAIPDLDTAWNGLG
jgi:hypothetical protein